MYFFWEQNTLCKVETMGFTSCAQSAGMKKGLKDEGLSFRVTTLFAVKYDLSVLSLWADAYNNKLLNNGRIPVTLTMKIQCTARRG